MSNVQGLKSKAVFDLGLWTLDFGHSLLRSAQWLSARADGVDLGFGSLHNLVWKRGEAQLFRVTFAVVQTPPEEINERLALGSILLLFVGEDVRVARNRIGACARRVCDRDAQVFGCGGDRFGGGCRD